MSSSSIRQAVAIVEEDGVAVAIGDETREEWIQSDSLHDLSETR